MCFSFCKRKYTERELFSKYTIDNTKKFEINGLQKCKVVSVYDADTLTIILPIHNHIYQWRCRLLNIDGAEIRTKNKKEKKVGIDGRNYLRSLLQNKECWIDCNGWDKYGRLLATFYLTKEDYLTGKWNKSINQKIINLQFAYFYDGKKKTSFDEWYK